MYKFGAVFVFKQITPQSSP